MAPHPLPPCHSPLTALFTSRNQYWKNAIKVPNIMKNVEIGKYSSPKKVHCEQSQYKLEYLGTNAQCVPKYSHGEQMLLFILQYFILHTSIMSFLEKLLSCCHIGKVWHVRYLNSTYLLTVFLLCPCSFCGQLLLSRKTLMRVLSLAGPTLAPWNKVHSEWYT